ncbi:sugar phosphate isomerase/epimerase [Paenibacillus segetis]|uniref:Sugar phosphate isomerase/epimerase n=1 Tax=Paenibacillus segetis TaxID=1325360 RepID=A0ABQ1YK55_9BACL|nr:sugar phosphate isomerase/epimerase [Paenibacillus segetis]GGH27146.1 hypothetical protein GCM10008013_28430 [Paenibacillus segetis]
MNNFMIGQYGSFDYTKYNRDFKDEFFGIEACLFNSEEDVLNLIKESKDRSFEVGVHFPLRAGQSDLRDALVLSQDQSVKESAFELIQNELEYMIHLKPKYILFHYPKPVILDDRVDWSSWRFTDSKEYVYESKYSINDFIENSQYLFQWLSAMSDKYNFIPVLEFDALNKYVYQTELLEELLNKYNKVKLCLDTGRLYLQEKIDPFFNSKEVIKKYAKYAEVIHLWTLQYIQKIEQYHYPVLPELSPSEGWAPIEDYLNIIREENRNVKIQFEHQSDFISDEDLERCYVWVDKILNS